MQHIVLLLFENEDINSRFISHMSAKKPKLYLSETGVRPEEFRNQDYSIFFETESSKDEEIVILFAHAP